MKFEQKVKKSFQKVKEDNESIKLALDIFNKDLDSIKTNSNEWIMYLMRENNQLKVQIEKLASQINELKSIQLRNF
ncbi:hypothetical protein HN415_07370 [Candidatus Woesearchaeota archaeon]|jgi:hypothetical protein|nr:hypothetical protein [Candidatus Woesearchaeota archaeon]